MTSRRADTPVQGPPSHQAPLPPSLAPAGTLTQAGTGRHSTSGARGGGQHVPSSTHESMHRHTISTDIRVHTPLGPALAHTCPHMLPSAGRCQPAHRAWPSCQQMHHLCTWLRWDKGTHIYASLRGRVLSHTRRHCLASGSTEPLARTFHTFSYAHSWGDGPAGLLGSAVPAPGAASSPGWGDWQIVKPMPACKTHTHKHTYG